MYTPKVCSSIFLLISFLIRVYDLSPFIVPAGKRQWGRGSIHTCL